MKPLPMHRKIRQCFTAATLLLLLFFTPVPYSAAVNPAKPITPYQAAGKVGEHVTVCGKVANTYYSCFVSNKPTFINFGKPYPDQVFSVAVMGEDRVHFDNCPEKLFAGRNVCVTGLIESYDGKPIMKVKDQKQVQWKD